MSIEAIYQLYQKHPSVQTDTRLLKPGDLFFALKGDNFDGNLFAQKAIDNGAAYAIIDSWSGGRPPERMLLVDNVLHTLQQLAKHHRQQFDIPFIAITGSNGKTTTKELVHAVLSTSFKTYTTKGNLNNHIGIPLTILSVAPDAEIAVIEMGANHLKEIEGYCRYTLPTHGMITNFGKAHLEGFGSVEGVRKGKSELFDYLRRHDGTAFVLWDDEHMRSAGKGIPEIIRYGLTSGDIKGSVIQSEPFLEIAVNGMVQIDTIETRLVGDYNAPNILAAVATGDFFKVPSEKIKQAIENYAPSNSRSQLIEKDSNRVILDAYNANPSSMKAAIENFAKTKGDNKILVLGAMAELGMDSIQEHLDIVSLIEKYHWKEVALVGGDFMKISHPFHQFQNSSEAKDWLQKKDFKNSFLLVKGSRSMKMEKVIGA